jgi:NhaP-type Na+/H+ or K+/H+ antiporter
MAVSVAMVAMFAVYVLNLPLGMAVLLGAILAPTDPVLATEVQTRHPDDRDRLRFTLTCEAGMNDGSAFPFVMLGLGLLGLHEIGDGGARWLLLDVLWACSAGVIVGVLAGTVLAKVLWRMQKDGKGRHLMHDFIALGLIGVVYGVCELMQAWGFLAVFFAGVALRQTEYRLREAQTEPLDSELVVEDGEAATETRARTVSEGSLIFKEHLERLSEVLLIILVGGSLFLNSWSWRAVALALFIFIVARPISALFGLMFSDAPGRVRAMVAWFGIRGTGSLYYLLYAIQHGLPEDQALELVHLTLIVVALSILIHGISVMPLMRAFRR